MVTGVSGVPEKLEHIIDIDRPTNLEDMRSLIQVAGYNAKLNHQEDKTTRRLLHPSESIC